TTQVMGADEVYVHLGRSPYHRSSRVEQAVGVALDDSVLAPRAEDPGADDLSTMIASQVEPFIAEAIETNGAPADIPTDWEWEPGAVPATSAGGRLNSLET